MAVFPEFRGLDLLKPVTIYRRSLPHWRQEGATYFVTFRLGDSIPAAKVREWQNQRAAWYAAHGLTGDLSPVEWQSRYRTIPACKRDKFERRSARQVLVELDRCHGSCVLRDRTNTHTVANALRFFDGERCRCGDFAVMPNHVHWLVLPFPGFSLEQITGAVKGYTAHLINAQSGSTGHVWQRESYDRLVRDSRELLRIRRYIDKNSVRSGANSLERTWEAEWLDGVQAIDLSS